MDPVKAYLRRRQNLIDQIRHRLRTSSSSAIAAADRILSDEEKAGDEKRRWQPAHWNPPKNCPEWYAEAFNEAYLDYLADGMHPDDIDLELIEDRMRSMHNTKRHRERLRLAVLSSLYRAAQVEDDDDEREPIINRVVLYEEAVARGVRLDEVNEALQLMAIGRKTRKEQNRLAYIVRRMKGGKNAKVGC
jgi:hypothetical protein